MSVLHHDSYWLILWVLWVFRGAMLMRVAASLLSRNGGRLLGIALSLFARMQFENGRGVLPLGLGMECFSG